MKRTFSARQIGEYEVTYKAYFKNFEWAYTMQEYPFTVYITDETESEESLPELPELEINT